MKYIIIFLTIIIYLLFQTSYFKINKIYLKSDKIKDELKILQISDFHNNCLINLEKLKASIDAYKPDLIFLTGDIISRDSKDDKLFKKFLSILSPYKTYFVSGNHELENKFIDYKEIIKNYGIVDLDSKLSELNINSDKINIYGLGFGENSIVAAKDSAYNILLCHNPDTFINSKKHNYDLVLSGHNHGGQVILPFLGQVIDHDFNLFPKFSSGLYKLYGSDFYISKGLGQKIYFRINCRVGIEEIEIKNVHSKE